MKHFQLDKNPCLSSSKVKTLLAAFDAAGAEVRFVGGCVRNAVMGLGHTDIDLATPAAPEAVMALLEKAGIRPIPTGLAHGTVTALVDGDTFEITTLRRDVTTDGRHAEVAYTDDWEQDAKRRDFTMNALYASPSGELFDYVGGVEDAKAGRVRFIGDAEQRIHEDALRILRLFRFQAQVGREPLAAEALQACERLSGMIDNLSGERIQAEMLKLLTSRDPIPALHAMEKSNVMAHVLPNEASNAALKKLVALESALALAPDNVLRLAALLPTSAQSADDVQARWKISNAIHQRLRDLVVPVDLHINATEAVQKKQIRALGNERYRDHLLLQWDDASAAQCKKAYDLVTSWTPPLFPITGADLVARGIPQGKELGRVLRELEEKWEMSGYKNDKQELLAGALEE